ncbi:MAG TPA: AAA family ATPase, partial [Atribacterota bacterium]|nr:AAA family ATPase [Atribacterota bacterium]
RLYYSKAEKTVRYDFGKTLLELRATGQTVFPLSIHTSGEFITWENTLPIKEISPSELYKITGKIASACILSKFWYEGTRQDISLCLSKILIEANWSKEEISEFFKAICTLSGDTDLKQRISGLYATGKKIEKGKPVYGIPKLKSLTSDRCVDKVIEWLQVKSEENPEEKKRSKLQIFSAAEIMQEEYSPTRYIVEDILPEGLIVLAGRPKTCKSFLALNLSLSIAAGKPALKKLATEKTGVLYFALEDGKKRLDKRMKNILGEDWQSLLPKDLFFCLKLNALDNGGFEDLEDALKENPGIGVIIIDTFAKIKPLSRAGNAYEADYKIAGQLQSWAITKGIALVMIHHTR